MSKWKDVKKVVLAYSGGGHLNHIEVAADRTRRGGGYLYRRPRPGRQRPRAGARRKAEMLGVKDIRIMDVREEFVRDFVFRCSAPMPSMKASICLALIACPLISKHLVDIAAETGADAVAHGATGKGNDQVRFELGLCGTLTSRSSRRGATGPSSRAPISSTLPKSTDPDRQGQAQRGPLGGREPAALLLRGQGAEDPDEPPEYVYQRTPRRCRRRTSLPRSPSASARAIRSR